MAGDKKGKSKMVAQKKKKRTREDREREKVEAVADAADRQGSLRIRYPQTPVQHEPLLLQLPLHKSHSQTLLQQYFLGSLTSRTGLLQLS